MDILLFTNNIRKAEYFSLKLEPCGHTVVSARTLATIHHELRFSDPDFVIVDSDTFPDPDNDYRTIIKLKKRKFLLFYDTELLSAEKNGKLEKTADTTVFQDRILSDVQQSCLAQIQDVLSDLLVHKTITDEHFTASTPEERRFLKQNEIRPPLALILSCLLRNMDSDITASTLLNLLWTDDETGHQQTLYAYINQTRMLLESRNIPLIIDRRAKGTYRICKSGDSKQTDAGGTLSEKQHVPDDGRADKKRAVPQKETALSNKTADAAMYYFRQAPILSRTFLRSRGLTM